jgi:hypothetical protein
MQIGHRKQPIRRCQVQVTKYLVNWLQAFLSMQVVLCKYLV